MNKIDYRSQTPRSSPDQVSTLPVQAALTW
jgi:hypothetical protein